MKVKDFMITDVISVTKHVTIKQLLETLVSYKIGGVPVVNDANQLLGVISDGDVLRYLQPKGRTVYDMFTLVLVSEKEEFSEKIQYALDKPVQTIMKRKAIYTVGPEDDLEAALAIFSKY